MQHDFEGLLVHLNAECGRCKLRVTNDTRYTRDDLDKSLPPLRESLKNQASKMIDELLDHECNPQVLDPT